MIPKQRILNLKLSLNNTEFGIKSLAILESVARVKDPIYKEIFDKIRLDESEIIIAQMKEKRKITSPDNIMLYDKVKTETREISAKIIALSLKTGVLEFPQSFDNETFTIIESDVKHTIANLLSNVLNLEN